MYRRSVRLMLLLGLLTFAFDPLQAQVPDRPAESAARPEAAHTASCPLDCPACARAIERGLTFVASRQLAAGGWGKDRPVPVYSFVNGLALLAEGSTSARGKYRAHVRRFIDWAVSAVPEDGAIGAGTFMETWQVAFATLALAAIHQREPVDGVQERLEALGRRLRTLQKPSGGWFHGGQPHANYSTDLVAATNLAVIALSALKREGIPFDETMLERALAYYRAMQNEDGGFSYGTAPHMEELKRSEGGRTAGALYALTLTGNADTATARKAKAWIDANSDTLHGDSVHGTFPQCFWISSMLCSRLGGRYWQRYREAYIRPLVKLQGLGSDGRIRSAPAKRAEAKGFEDLRKFRRFGFSSIAYDTALGLLAWLHPFGHLSFDPGAPPAVRTEIVARANRRPAVDEPAEKRRVRLALGRAFLRGEGRTEFVAMLRESGLRGDDWIDIGWIVPGEDRYLGVLLSRTPAQIERMSDAEYEAYRKAWSVDADRAYRRWHPLPGELTGYGTEAQRNRCIRTTWSLIHAQSKAAFLAQVKDRIGDSANPLFGGKATLTLLFHTKSGNLTMYGLSAPAIERLTEAQFVTWRARFLRWVEIHIPGQSDVARFATLSDEAFEAYLRKMRDQHRRLALRRTLRKLENRTGIEIERPRFAASRTSATLAAITPDSPAAKAGLRAGDTVVRVEEFDTSEWDDLIYRVDTYREGSKVKLEVERGGKRVVGYVEIPRR